MALSVVASEKENVLISVAGCAVTVLPQFGGKIASIRVDGQELLQAPLAPYAPRTRTMPFDAGDASGWDECLPSVAACTVQSGAETAEIPDHGDLWRVEWQQLPEVNLQSPNNHHLPNSNSLKLRGDCFSLPLALERTIALRETSKGWELQLDYTITNMSDGEVPWSWAAHPLFVAETGDRIVLPESITSLRLEGSGGGRLGKGGEQVNWPIATLTDGSLTDFSVAQGPESGIGDKLFAGPLTAKENWCALERPCAGVVIRVRFDPTATPYLGLWICYGGWPDRPGPKQVCVALEPATAQVDSLATEGSWSRTLSARESYKWPMTVEIETIKNVS